MTHSFLLRRSAIIALGVASWCCASSSSVQAAPNLPVASAPAQHVPVVELDVVDRSGASAAQNVRLSLPVSERGGTSTIETRAGSAEYRLSVFREGPTDTPGPLRVDLRRNDLRQLERAEQRNDLKLAFSVQLERGKRALVTRLERPDGSTTEVVATLR
jgi:hypothetical protein